MNWSKGILKIRGKKEDIKRFLIFGLSPVSSTSEEYSKKLNIEFKTPMFSIHECILGLCMISDYGFTINNATFAWIDGNINWTFSYKDFEILTINSFRQHEKVNAYEFAEISKTYNLDFKIHVKNDRLRFNQHVEIRKGEVMKNDTIIFENYEWDCVFTI